jgi:putative membrane protein
MYKNRRTSEGKIKKVAGGVLVLCIDRDNDLGEKTGIKGPVMGRSNNIDAAQKLLVADPGESDANSIFGAVREYDELLKRGITAYIATLTGDDDVGTVSDMVIERQLEKVIKEYNPDKVVFVSDGAEDEYLMPVVQSRVPIISIKRIVVRQSVKLESDYYVMLTFFKEVMSDARTKRILLGIPALILVTYAIYGNIAWRFTIGLTGLYLIIKGFQLEDMVEAFARDIKASLSTGGKLSFFLFILSALFASVGLYLGYGVYTVSASEDLIVSSMAFVEAGLVYFLIAAISFITAKLLMEKGTDRKPFRYLTFYALTFSVYILVENIIVYVTTPTNTLKLILSMVASFMIIFVAIITEKIAFSKAAEDTEVAAEGSPRKQKKRETPKKPVREVVF